MTVKMTFDAKQFVENVRSLRAKFPRAYVRAANRTATTAATALSRAVSKDMGIKVSDVRKNIRIKNATLEQPVAVVSATVRRVPLIAFKGRGPWPSRGRGIVRAMGKTYPNAFIAVVGRGRHKGIFTRPLGDKSLRKSKGAWSKNLPITELRGPSVWESARKHVNDALAKASEAWVKNMTHELNWVMSRGR